MAIVDIQRGCSEAFEEFKLSFLNDYPDNFGFFVYGTYVGNRVSISVLYTPQQEFEKYGGWKGRWKPSGFELEIGEVHVILKFKGRKDIKAKVDKIVESAQIFEKVARKYGYPFDGIWSVGGWAEDKAKMRRTMLKEMRGELG